jgi:hypothetical protein
MNAHAAAAYSSPDVVLHPLSVLLQCHGSAATLCHYASKLALWVM